MIKNCNLLIPRPREHPALQTMEFTIFIFLWVIFAVLDPDQDSESGFTDLIESGSETLVPNTVIHKHRARMP
jgi:hypothetical protein